MGKKQNISGNRYGSLVALEPLTVDRCGSYLWLCDCDCGEQLVVSIRQLNSGAVKSCGCSRLGNNETHGHSTKANGGYTRTYTTWQMMKKRCLDPSHKHYKYYGGVGITICDRWVDSFADFLEDMGERPEGKSLDRVDGTRGYFKDNCRWATRIEQQNNMKNNRILKFNEEYRSLTQWARQYNMKPATLNGRLKYGWCIKCALTTPVMGAANV